MNQLELSALFYAGKLFQIGDLVKGQGEYLDNRYGFTKFDTGGIITKIIVKKDTICNSLYLNHGVTYNSIGGLGYIFELNGKQQYAFENKTLAIPYKIQEKRDYFRNYYLLELNKDKLQNLLDFIKKEHHQEIKLSKLGDIISKEYPEIFDYFFLCLRIRNGEFGTFYENNELSNITMKVLSEKGFNNTTTNYLFKLTSDNSRNPLNNNNSYYKTF